MKNDTKHVQMNNHFLLFLFFFFLVLDYSFSVTVYGICLVF